MRIFDFIEQGSYNDSLKCFHCGFEYTHVCGIAWYRRGEDEDQCSTVIAGFENCEVVKTDNSNNPSGRRDGLRIIYNCENCGDFSSLSIAQHKGNTFISVDDCPESLLSKKFCV